jgi:N-acetylglucosaminyldiphosphoundecaprenol N-acetyl-beta-D-mannosaminyltransferase
VAVEAVREADRNPTPNAGEAPRLVPLPRDDFDRDVWCILGLPIDMTTTAGAAIAIEAAVRERRRLSLVTPNVNWLVRAHRDPHARRQIIDADLSLADGAPVAALARLLGAPIGERAAGADLFEALRLRPGFAGRRIRVFFFGGRNGAAEAAARRLAAERGGLETAGFLNPGFGDVASMSGAETIAAINAARPDFVVVSLGAAKGQDWIEANAARLEAPVIAHLGAVVDFTGGTIRRAPPALARLGFEWLFRIYAEPALWRRYAGDGLRFLAILARRLPAARAARLVGPPAEASLEHTPGGTLIRIAGAPAHGGLGPVREAFRAAAAASGDVIVDMSAAAGADPAFLGQVLMLEKATRARGARLRLSGLSPRLAALFTANSMNYADAGSHAAADIAAGRVRVASGQGQGR